MTSRRRCWKGTVHPDTQPKTFATTSLLLLCSCSTTRRCHTSTTPTPRRPFGIRNRSARATSRLVPGPCPCPKLVPAIYLSRLSQPLFHNYAHLTYHRSPNWLMFCYRNGVADRVTVIHKSSGALKPGVDLPLRGVDVVVTELVDSGLLGERIVPVLSDARARGLLAKGGRAIPEVLSVLVMWCHWPRHNESWSQGRQFLSRRIGSYGKIYGRPPRSSPLPPRTLHELKR